MSSEDEASALPSITEDYLQTRLTTFCRRDTLFQTSLRPLPQRGHRSGVAGGEMGAHGEKASSRWRTRHHVSDLTADVTEEASASMGGVAHGCFLGSNLRDKKSAVPLATPGR